MDVKRKFNLLWKFYFAFFTIGAVLSLLTMNFYGILGPVIYYWATKDGLGKVQRNRTRYYQLLLITGALCLLAITVVSLMFYAEGFSSGWEQVGIIAFSLPAIIPFLFLLQGDVRRYLKGE